MLHLKYVCSIFFYIYLNIPWHFIIQTTFLCFLFLFNRSLNPLTLALPISFVYFFFVNLVAHPPIFDVLLLKPKPSSRAAPPSIRRFLHVRCWI
uniref:Uncharacterized protein n=1 Tax=Cucumis melo TaxID=3656 RepID=A0A9I9ELY8_CUCME